MNNQSVINAFVCGKSAKSSNGNLKSFGNRLVSYYTTIAERLADGTIVLNLVSYYTTIAERLADGTIVLNRTKYSVSTSKIQTWLLGDVLNNKLKHKEVYNVPLGASDLAKYMK